MPHLAYALDDDDEFLHPVHGWFLLSRAVVFDSWICWRQALPDSRQVRNAMPASVGASIALLAHALHDIHQALPGYDDLDDNPFSVPRWWDPDADDEWGTGSCCLFRCSGQPASAFVAAWEARRHRSPGSLVRLVPVSNAHIEAALVTVPAVPPPWIGSGCPPPAGRSSKPGRRKPPTPRPGTAGQHPDEPQPAHC